MEKLNNENQSGGPSILKRTLWLLCSILIILALHACIEVIQTVDNNSWVLGIIWKINNSYMRFELYDMLMLAAMQFAYGFLDGRGSKRDWRAAVLAAAFAVAYTAARSIQSTGSFAFINGNSYQYAFSALCCLGWFLLFYLLLRLCFTLAERSGEGTPTELGAKRIWWLCFGAVLICWLPWTLANYPGTFCLDSYDQIGQYMGDIPWTNYSPVFSTWLMGTLISAGELIWDRNFGCYLYLLLQTVVGAAVFSFGVRKIYGMGAGKALCAVITGFFALAPMWGLFAQWYEKDLLYAELAALNLLLAFDVVETGKCSRKAALGLALSGMLMSFARNNGIYAAATLMAALVFYLKRRDRLRAGCSLGAVLAVYLLVTAAVYPALGIESGSIRDMLGITAQQTARYVMECGDEVSPEERQAIDAVFDYDKMDMYIPSNADNIKNTYREDGSKLSAYFKTWLKMGLKRPEVYAEAFTAKSYGYLAPIERDSEVHVMQNAEALNKYGIYSPLDSRLARGFEFISKLGVNLPVINYLMSPGLYTWVMLGCIALLRKHRRRRELILFIPAIVNTIFCIGSPLHNSIRYALPVAATLPFLIALACITVRQKGGEK